MIAFIDLFSCHQKIKKITGTKNAGMKKSRQACACKYLVSSHVRPGWIAKSKSRRMSLSTMDAAATGRCYTSLSLLCSSARWTSSVRNRVAVTQTEPEYGMA